MNLRFWQQTPTRRMTAADKQRLSESRKAKMIAENMAAKAEADRQRAEADRDALLLATELALIQARSKMQTEMMNLPLESSETKHLEKMIDASTKLSGMVAEFGPIGYGDQPIGPIYDPYLYQTTDAIDEANFRQLGRNAYQFWATNGFGCGLVELFTKMTVGQQCQMKAVDEDPATQAVLDEFCQGYELPNGRKTQPFTRIANWHVRRKFRDTDSMMRVFVNKNNGDLHVRFLNPWWVANDGAHGPNALFGVVTNPDDIEDVYSYLYAPRNDYNWISKNITSAVIPAGDVIHAKGWTDSDSKRGRPLVNPIMPALLEYIKLLNYRRRYHLLRLEVAKNKVYKNATSDQIAAIKQRELATNLNEGQYKVRANRPGSVEYQGDNLTVEYATPNLQAVDAQYDFIAQAGQIICGLGITSTMFNGDTSNSNYNSGVLAESPAERTFITHQCDIDPDFKNLGERVIKAKMQYGGLPKMSYKTETNVSPGKAGVSPSIVTKSKTTIPRCTEITCDYPRANQRDILRLTQALVFQHQERAISLDTMRADLDRDGRHEDKWLAIEDEKMRQEMELHPMEEEELGKMGMVGSRTGRVDKNGDSRPANGNGSNGNGRLQSRLA